MNISQPLISRLGGVHFGHLSADDIRALSVQRIQNTETFDSLLHPVPGGLCDPALGASGDTPCATCHLSVAACPGHCGHIELPVPVYHATFFDQLLLLLRAQCAACGRFRLADAPRVRATCKLRLLSHGLLQDAHDIDNITDESILWAAEREERDPDSGNRSDELVDALNDFTRKAIRHKLRAETSQPSPPSRTEPLNVERRHTIHELFRNLKAARLCAFCNLPSPSYRKDGYNKIFRRPFSDKDWQKWVAAERQPVNYLVERERAKKKPPSRTKPSNRQPVDEGIVADMDDDEGDDVDAISINGDGKDDAGADDQDVLDEEVAEAESDEDEDDNKWREQKFMDPEEIYANISCLFEKEHEILNLVYDARTSGPSHTANPRNFFITTLLVAPLKFRPIAYAAGTMTEPQENNIYKRVLSECQILNQIRQELTGQETAVTRRRTFLDFQTHWVGLQDAVNSLLDSDRNPVKPRGNRVVEEGIKQRLEKKEGLFRQNMMGKRVNFAARTVISPDPNIETNEIGVPPVFAKKLTYPEPVTNHNYYELKEAVLNGLEKWPGAAAIENENGQVINLRNKTFDERQALANQLLAPSGAAVNGARNKKVHRHLNNGDVVIMNRQPTLHKPSMMAHRARVLPGEKTLRMHYSNCNAYNADFDGDEMNMHFPQNEIARAEALSIADTDNQYLVATAGKPLRGLIQDHISVAVWLTNKDTFFTRAEYQELLFSCLRPDALVQRDRIELVAPAIIKPVPRWTGKQIVTTVLKNLTPPRDPGLTLACKAQTPGDQWDDESKEGDVLFQNSELIHGILDKGNLGPATGGFVHAVYEAYSATAAGKLLSILGRLLTKFLNMRAFSCGMEDLVLTKEGDETRRQQLKEAERIGHEIASKYVTLDAAHTDQQRLKSRLEEVLRDENKQAGLDSVYNSRTATVSSDITRACLPAGLWKPFPRNQMQSMTISGAKGSKVNANLISCNLGQQVLEGRRVPVMVSGKSLPSFKPFESQVRAGGYITDRFLSGVRPQEYFFHAMAGREGLIDTAVKTSRSGYLQRCLIKGMEGLKVEYDTSVRDADGCMIQTLYGEDGLDVTKQKLLTNFKFMGENFMAIIEQLNVQEAYERIHSQSAADWSRKALKAFRKSGRLDCFDPVLSRFNPGSTWGSTSEAFTGALKDYLDENPDNLLKDKKKTNDSTVSKRTFSTLLDMKYLKSTVDPGEAVGVVAGQSVGEPSTQMTLNTFHLAGHAAKNVTLGIPRLREIVMTASRSIATPTMTLPLNPQRTADEGHQFAKGISKLTLAEVMDRVEVQQTVGLGVGYSRARTFNIRLVFFPASEYEETYAITKYDIQGTIRHKFIPQLVRLIRKAFRSKTSRATAASMNIGKSQAPPAQERAADNTNDAEEAETAEAARTRDEAQADEDSDLEANPDDDATEQKQKAKNTDNYEELDEEEQAIANRPDPDPGSGDVPEDEGYGGSPPPNDKRPAEDKRERIILDKEQEADLIAQHEDLTAYAFDKHGGWCDLSFEYDAATPKLLMLELVEAACHSAVIQFIPGLKSCSLITEKGKEPYVMTEGVNLVAMRDYQHLIDPNRMRTNDIGAMLERYGVEAARATIIAEMDEVFSAHSIAVDRRHLTLIADMMTRHGTYLAFSRMGMRDGTSPLAKMSFETTVNFLRDAVLDAVDDTLAGPSARIVTGQPSRVGTGSFDILMPLTTGDRGDSIGNGSIEDGIIGIV